MTTPTPDLLRPALRHDPFAGDFGDPGDRMLRDRIVRFRKRGQCCECLGPIEPKSHGRALTMLWQADRSVRTYRICAACTEAMARFVETDDEGCLLARSELREQRARGLAHRCEVCEGPATHTCGMDGQPMLDFCDLHYRDHVREAHGLHDGAEVPS